MYLKHDVDAEFSIKYEGAEDEDNVRTGLATAFAYATMCKKSGMEGLSYTVSGMLSGHLVTMSSLLEYEEEQI